MIFSKIKFPALFISGCLCVGPVLAEQTWHLMSRHGECTDMAATMRHKLEDFPNVTTPEAFVKALKDRGLEAELTVPPNGTEGLLLANIPARNWSLLIVRKDRCSSFSQGPK